MAKYATRDTARKSARKQDTVNRTGAEAFNQSDKVKLASILLTSFVQDEYYRSGNETQKELKALIKKVDPQFAAKAAIYARNEFGMRSITHIVGGEIPARVKGEKWTKRFIDRVIYRPDDATEILAYYLSEYGKPVPNSLKKGLALGLTKFDAYQLAKYRGEGNAVSLVDVVNLVHVKPNEKNSQAFEALVDGELKSQGTWETKLSAAGKTENKAAAKEQAWAELISERKIGYLALLKNLRNIETQAPEVLDAALAMLVDEKLIKKSLVLPFRFATAVDQVNETKTIRALNKALDISCSNVPKLSGKTLIAVDHSGSMGGMGRYGTGSYAGSNRAKADLFAAILAKANEADVMIFGNDASYVRGLNPDDSVLSIQKQINAVDNGHSTNFPAVFARATKKYDRVITISDMQSYQSAGFGYSNPQKARATYERKHGNVHYYNFDLAGLGTRMVSDTRTYEIAGISEKVFEIMQVLEQDKDALVHKIEAIQL